MNFMDGVTLIKENIRPNMKFFIVFMCIMFIVVFIIEKEINTIRGLLISIVVSFVVGGILSACLEKIPSCTYATYEVLVDLDKVDFDEFTSNYEIIDYKDGCFIIKIK